MKKKFVKSDLTARERKRLREKQAAVSSGQSERLTAEEYEKKAPRVRVFAIAAIVAAVILIAVGITVPCVMAANYMFERNPIAVFELTSGGEKFRIEYEIYAADCPNAANNFMYLASIGFFDGNIIFDTQNSQVRFGGYYDPTYDEDKGEWDYKHRSDDLDFINGIKERDFAPAHYADAEDPDVFKYRIKKDSASFSVTEVPLALCANTSASAASATEFQFNCDPTADAENLIDGVGTSSQKKLDLEVFAAPLHEEEAREVFDRILSLDKYSGADGSPEYARKYFRAPEQTVTITRVRVYNYDALWLDSSYEYGFESYMLEKGAFTTSEAGQTWSKEYI